jgi:3-dehydroquinate synthase
VGFAVAIAHRGLRLVRLPTTTLSQADSGVGVKNGVNLFEKKNWLGAFAVPWAVVNDAALLETLSDRDFVAGFSEAVKVSLLKDPAFFQQLCSDAPQIRRRELPFALPAIRSSAQWHLRHITQGGDPFEMLEARPLDFGHWSAHKLETMTGFRLRHGEAVAIGVAIDTVYSSLALGLPPEDALAVLECLCDLGFVLDDPVLRDTDLLFNGLEEFRQHLGGRLTLTMLQGVGKPIDVHEIDKPQMELAIRRVAALGGRRRLPNRTIIGREPLYRPLLKLDKMPL